MQWALIRGLKTSGVSTQFMAKKMDAGDVLEQIRVDLDPNEGRRILARSTQRSRGRITPFDHK